MSVVVEPSLQCFVVVVAVMFQHAAHSSLHLITTPSASRAAHFLLPQSSLPPTANRPPPTAPTGLVGTIPATVINAARLSYLDVSLNTLSGSIPPLPAQLSVFAAADNLLTGELPESLGTSLELKRISVQGNRLSGSLPQGIADTAPLSVLELQVRRRRP